MKTNKTAKNFHRRTQKEFGHGLDGPTHEQFSHGLRGGTRNDRHTRFVSTRAVRRFQVVCPRRRTGSWKRNFLLRIARLVGVATLAFELACAAQGQSDVATVKGHDE